jgi:hypothetical protein
MSLHPDLPSSPYAPLVPEQRWFPADETLRAIAYEKLLPPLVAKVRREVHAWRAGDYSGASPTSQAHLHWWFDTEHLVENADGSRPPFRYYFAVGFKIDYVKADGDLSTYTPDFIVRTADRMVWIVETKGREELDLPQKMARLRQWCTDATAAEENGQRYDFVLWMKRALRDISRKHSPPSRPASPNTRDNHACATRETRPAHPRLLRISP